MILVSQHDNLRNCEILVEYSPGLSLWLPNLGTTPNLIGYPFLIMSCTDPPMVAAQLAWDRSTVKSTLKMFLRIVRN